MAELVGLKSGCPDRPSGRSVDQPTARCVDKRQCPEGLAVVSTHGGAPFGP